MRVTLSNTNCVGGKAALYIHPKEIARVREAMDTVRYAPAKKPKPVSKVPKKGLGMKIGSHGFLV